MRFLDIFIENITKALKTPFEAWLTIEIDFGWFWALKIDFLKKNVFCVLTPRDRSFYVLTMKNEIWKLYGMLLKLRNDWGPYYCSKLEILRNLAKHLLFYVLNPYLEVKIRSEGILRRWKSLGFHSEGGDKKVERPLTSKNI